MVSIFTLPLPSTDLAEGPAITDSDKGLRIHLTFCLDGDDPGIEVVLRFDRARAYRKISEIYCTPEQINRAYDTVYELHESSWVKQLKDACPSEWKERWVLRHFMLYIDSFGCFEVIAESVNIESAGSPGGK